MERIDKLLALQLSISRKEAAALVRQGAVTAGGQQVKNAAEKVDPAAVCVRGASIHYTPFLYLLLDKPAGVLTAARDKRAKTVFDCIDPHLLRRGVQPVGRLDKDTTGLLLLTDNGALAHRLLSPKCHVEKRYLARLASMPPADTPARFAKGLVLDDGPCLPAGFSLRETGEHPLCEITLHEGRFHQVKRMCAAVGAPVLSLRRIGFGPLSLPDLPSPAACRRLSSDEISELENLESVRRI